MAKYCQNCGAKLEENADVCLKCGSFVNNGYQNNNENCSPNSKSKIVAGLFGIFLGAFGVHNFYLGFNSRGKTQLLLTFLSCGMLSPITSLWGLIEGVMYLVGSRNVDADGIPLTN